MKHRDTRRAGPLVFRDPVLLCGALYVLLYFDASGFLRLGLLAAFLHEWGHILLYCAFFHRFPVIEVTMTGFCMRLSGASLSPGRRFWLAAAGPAVNFLLAGLWALRLQFTTENPGEIDKILMDYQGRAAFDAGSYTRGLYSRGVE